MPPPPRLLLPRAPALVAGHGTAAVLTPDGELAVLPAGETAALLERSGPPLLVHAPASARRLGLPPLAGAFDLLELFAFVRPAEPCAPTPRGLAAALGHAAAPGDEALAALLPELAVRLLRRLGEGRDEARQRDAAPLAARMGEAGWPWARPVLAALGQPGAEAGEDALKVWRRLPEWEEAAPVPPPASHPVAPGEARARLAAILGPGAEQRPGQADYASAAAGAFRPREAPGAPAVVLAEAGTGTGKTLGYVAPASLWAERNGAPVWISTYTRNLQRQIDQELGRVYPDPEERRRRVVIRKGRENYLCLLNYDEVAAGAPPPLVVPLGLVARWARATRDGDLVGGDFPGWLVELFGAAAIWPLADRRGECVHSACPHYRRCFVEHTIRRARGATLVVANHALVMVQAAFGGGEDGTPLRLVFDEGHHLFDAADAAFSAELSGLEGAELRRWLLGAEGGRSRARGLRRRIEELAALAPGLGSPLDAALAAARALPAPGWTGRLAAAPGSVDGRAVNPAEDFLREARRQVLARAARDDGHNAAECDLHPLSPGLPEAGAALETALRALEAPLLRLRALLLERLEAEGEPLETGERIRLDAGARALERRALAPLRAWTAMLGALRDPPTPPGTRPAFVDWLAVERREGREVDAALRRHHLDPTAPFAAIVAAPAHGLLITSATLRDAGPPRPGAESGEDAEAAWVAAEARTGAVHLPLPAVRAAVASPFDYAAATRCLVVTDVARHDEGQVAAAMRDLFLAAGGGALGLFTAIRRLRACHARMAASLAAAGLPLLAQHVDAMDNSSLVDAFRAEENACLLGTDAMRDGIDVPGRSLRLLVFDRVPWPRPTILHRERRLHLSEGRPGAYDDAVARHRLRQAFGRLVRRADDRGAFVLLDRSCPSRLLSGLPEGVAVERLGLRDAAATVAGFLAP